MRLGDYAPGHAVLDSTFVPTSRPAAPRSQPSAPLSERREASRGRDYSQTDVPIYDEVALYSMNFGARFEHAKFVSDVLVRLRIQPDPVPASADAIVPWILSAQHAIAYASGCSGSPFSAQQPSSNSASVPSKASEHRHTATDQPVQVVEEQLEMRLTSLMQDKAAQFQKQLDAHMDASMKTALWDMQQRVQQLQQLEFDSQINACLESQLNASMEAGAIQHICNKVFLNMSSDFRRELGAELVSVKGDCVSELQQQAESLRQEMKTQQGAQGQSQTSLQMDGLQQHMRQQLDSLRHELGQQQVRLLHSELQELVRGEASSQCNLVVEGLNALSQSAEERFKKVELLIDELKRQVKRMERDMQIIQPALPRREEQQDVSELDPKESPSTEQASLKKISDRIEFARQDTKNMYEGLLKIFTEGLLEQDRKLEQISFVGTGEYGQSALEAESIERARDKIIIQDLVRREIASVMKVLEVQREDIATMLKSTLEGSPVSLSNWSQPSCVLPPGITAEVLARQRATNEGKIENSARRADVMSMSAAENPPPEPAST